MYTTSQILEFFDNTKAYQQQTGRVPSLYEPVNYIMSLGGKHLRPALFLMAYSLYKQNVSQVLTQALAFETFHNSTLIHDDLMDDSATRRGHDTVHIKYTPNIAILSGDAMIVLAMQQMGSAETPHIQKIMTQFTRTMMEVFEGQQLDLEFEERTQVTIEEYTTMIELKTAALLAGALRVGGQLAEAPAHVVTALDTFGRALGIAFQIQDDLLDLYGDEKLLGKRVGDDVMTGKKTILMTHAYAYADDALSAKITNWLATDSLTREEKMSFFQDLFEQTQSRAYAEEQMKTYTQQAQDALDIIANEGLDVTPFRELTTQLLTRKK